MPERGGRGVSGRVTLEQVARHAGVSRALVSIVMRDAPGASTSTRDRVRAAAAELGYRPDVRARALAGQSSRLIGVMFGVGAGTFHFDLLEGLYQAAEARDLNLLLTAVTPRRNEQKAAESLQGFSFDGLIMLGPPTGQPLLAGRVPVVVVGWQVDDPAVDVVRTSDTEGMSAALAHLVELGHRRIAHLDGGSSVIAKARREAYVQQMQVAGLGANVRVVPGGQSQLDGQHAAHTLLGEPDRPTALICYNDDTAAAAISVFAQQGLRVPVDISVLGWDDNEAAALAPVRLTSVAQHPHELARLAVARIAARRQHDLVEPRDVVLSPELRVRDSTSAPPPA